MRSEADAERIRRLARDVALSRIKDLKEELAVNVRLPKLYEGIEPGLFRFPAVDPPSLRAAVESLAST